jgi:hypothetical protein
VFDADRNVEALERLGARGALIVKIQRRLPAVVT